MECLWFGFGTPRRDEPAVAHPFCLPFLAADSSTPHRHLRHYYRISLAVSGTRGDRSASGFARCSLSDCWLAISAPVSGRPNGGIKYCAKIAIVCLGRHNCLQVSGEKCSLRSEAEHI